MNVPQGDVPRNDGMRKESQITNKYRKIFFKIPNRPEEVLFLKAKQRDFRILRKKATHPKTSAHAL